MITCRLARDDDLPAMRSLYAELRPQDPPLDALTVAALWTRVLAEPRARVFVATDDDAPVATAMLAWTVSLAQAGRPFGVIEHVVTAGSHRGRGIGRRLLDHLLAFAWQQRCCKVMLLSGAARIEAHRLYRAAGFDGDVERGFVVKAPDLA